MLTELGKSLLGAIEGIEVVDCHEHLPPEKRRLETPVDVFTLFSHYTKVDLFNAGMSLADYQALFNQSIPLDRRWSLFAPYWQQIRFTSYSRAALLAAQRFYGFDDIDETNYQALSEAIRENNTPGIYERVLKDACGIRAALTQCGTTQTESPLLIPLMMLHSDTQSWQGLAHPGYEPNAEIHTLDDHIDAFRRYVARVKSEGAVGLKVWANRFQEPSREKAVAAFERLRSGADKSLPYPNPLADYVIDQSIAIGAEQDMVIAVHTGVWSDFRNLDPLHMIPLIQRHPRARFDIYHLGYPWVRETLMLGKGFPNVWINLCWTHVISQRCSMDALDEAIDLLPANKLMAFGGDYNIPVEKVYGHLTMAREDVARVLAARVERKLLTETQAMDLARKWFWENGKDLYRLKL